MSNTAQLILPQNQIVVNKETTLITNPNTGFMGKQAADFTLNEIRNNHIIPVFSKDNMQSISQTEFIESTAEIAADIFGKNYQSLAIKLSHPRKGRIPSARGKAAADLLEHEKTVYYERSAFLMEFPIANTVQGNDIFLTVAGVKAYNLDNLNTDGLKGRQHFKIAVGFKVQVCTNLCMWADGANLEIEVKSLDALGLEIRKVLSNYSQKSHLEAMRQFGEYEISEKQFATILGKTRMYQHLPRAEKLELPILSVSDTQINNVSKAYYKDPNFSVLESGKIDLWRLYNCFTESVKSSYIDTFLDRSVNAFDFTQGIQSALIGESKYSWFLS